MTQLNDINVHAACCDAGLQQKAKRAKWEFTSAHKHPPHGQLSLLMSRVGTYIIVLSYAALASWDYAGGARGDHIAMYIGGA